MRMLALILGFALLALLAGPTPEATAESAADEAAYGAGSVLGTLLYAPLKTSFCVIGAVTGGLTLPFGGTDTAGDVAAAACGGTWAITPDVLKGIHLSMASRIVKLLKVTGIKSGTALVTGGLALDSGLVAAIQEEMANEKVDVKVASHPDSIYAGAIGAALWGAFRHGKLAQLTERAAA